MNRTDFLALIEMIPPVEGETILVYFRRNIKEGVIESKDLSYMCESYGMSVLSFEVSELAIKVRNNDASLFMITSD